MGNAPAKSGSDLSQVLQEVVAKYWPVILAGILFVVVQLPALKSWMVVWDEKDGYYSHGYLVPFIAAFMLWTRRSALAKAKITPSWWGLVLLLLFIPVHFIGLVLELRAVYGVAFFMCIFGVVLLMLGKQVTRTALIPLLFLMTMIPAASWILDAQTARTQVVSATAAVKLLQITTPYDITQNGVNIHSPSLPGPGVLRVGLECSGLRLLISLITFSWFFTYVIKAAWWKKVVLLGMSLPLSVFVNSLRITMIAYVGFWTGSTDAVHTFHDWSGYIGLVVCFVILFGIAKLLRAGDLYTGENVTAKPEDSTSTHHRPVGAGPAGVVAIVVLLAAAAVSTFATPIYNFSKGKLDRSTIPMSFDSWQGQDLEIDEGSRQLLHMGDLLSRGYLNREDADRPVHVFITAAQDISAFHNPLLCLPGGGSQITETQNITLTFEEPRPITVQAQLLRTDGKAGIMVHWYMMGDKSYNGTQVMQNANRAFKLEDLRRVTSKPWDTSDVRSDVKARKYTWYRFSTEAIGVDDQEYLEDFITQFIARVSNFGE